MTAPNLALEFATFVPHAHLIKGRDAKLIANLRDYHAYDAVDILWSMVQYVAADQPRDVPSFCRWVARTDPVGDTERLQREAELAAAISHQRIPPAALVWYDLVWEELAAPALVQAFRSAQTALQQFANSVLGVPV